MTLGQLRIFRSLTVGQFKRQCRMFASRPAEEIKIPMPFGHLSGKVWGSRDGQPVLALHGWQDNAGTFDLLVPHLDPSFRIVAVDLPGHGLSSHLPPGSIYHYMENLLFIKMVVDHLKWTRCSLLGHSMGGGLSLLFASLFPDIVESVVSIDMMKPVSCSQSDMIWQTRTAIENAIETFGKSERATPVYSSEEAGDRLVRGSLGSLSEESASVMMRRGAAPSEDCTGVVFTRDIRLQISSIQKVDDESSKIYLGGVKCNLLIIKALLSYQVDSEETVQFYNNMYTRNCTRYFYKQLEGKHHIHIDHPEQVAALVNPFLMKLYSKL